MKHYSAADLSATGALLTDQQLLAGLRRELDGTRATKRAIAFRLGCTEAQLTRLLRGQQRLPPRIAVALGFRQVTRFEKVS
jgi:ParB-like chromosome segregation protein Spo0J